MSVRLPGADGLDAFWKLIVDGGTAWGPLPDARFRRELYFDPQHKGRVGRSYSDIGGLVSDRPVDPAVCPFTPQMAERFDVAHGIFLEVASLACRDAGLDPFAMPADRRTGVYVGHTGGSSRIGDIVYATGVDGAAAMLVDVDAARESLGPAADEVARELTDEIRSRYPGRRPGTQYDLGAIGAARIVHEALRLHGPYLVVDAACASSLQALAVAARAVQEGSIDQAIVGGASYCKSDSLVLFSAAQSVSATGSRPFDAAADGLVTAEGYVALVVKSLARAVADGDRIRAVIRGLGVACDGKGKSLWAPRQEGQLLAVERAYSDAWPIGSIEYIEAHATSTQVGDATELAALARLLRPHLPPGRKIPIGSVKANIGHTLETAGLASLVKVVLAIEQGVIPPGSTCRDLNEEFDWEGGPFEVPRRPIPWPTHADGSPRRAAVNAFGIGGLNVHVSIAEHRPNDAATAVTARPRDRDQEAIAIVGMGCVLPGALSAAEFPELVARGASAIGPIPAERWDSGRALDRSGPRTWHVTGEVGGFVRGFVYDWRRHKVPPKQIAAANPLQFMLLAAADEAIAGAGGIADKQRTAVVVGTLFGGDFANQLQVGLRLPETCQVLRRLLERRGITADARARIADGFERKVLELMPALLDETGSFTSSTLASRLTKTFDLMGGALALDSGDCSSLSALAAAVDMLRQGSCDTVVCAAGQRSLDLVSFEGRSLNGILADGPTSSLLGATSGGDVPGEGAVVLVLRRLADARAAGNPVRGVIRGIAVSAGPTDDAGASWVVEAASAQAGLLSTAVRAAEIAMAAGSAATSRGLAALVEHHGGTSAGDQPRLVAGSLDGLIGHTGAVAGAAGVLKLCTALGSGSMPGSCGLSDGRIVAAGLCGSGSALTIEPVDGDGYRAGCVTVVDGAQFGHVVLDNGRTIPADVDATAIRARETARVRTAHPRPGPRVAGDAPGAIPARPLVAALFPGQGSQYAGMFRQLVADSAAARAALEMIDARAREAGHETLSAIAWRQDHGMGTRIWDTQWAVYLADLLAWETLRHHGFEPDIIASHSFGEFPSLTAAGCWTFADGAHATRARANAVEQHGPRHGGMLSIVADRTTVADAIAPFAGQAWFCAENAPEQFVIGGTAGVIDAIELVLEAASLRSKRLAVPSPFHTPLLSVAAGYLATALNGLSIAAPRVPTYGSSTARPLVDPTEIRDSLIRQMTATVRWIDVVESLFAAGVRTFVEVGPSGVLTGLARRILAGRPGLTFLQFDKRGRPAGEHLAEVVANLTAVGAIRPRATTSPVPEAEVPRTARVVSFDATARRRARNRGAVMPVAPAGDRRAPGPSSAASAIDDFLPGTGSTASGMPSRGTPPHPSSATAAVRRDTAVGALRTAVAEAPPSINGKGGSKLECFVSQLLANEGLTPPLEAHGPGSEPVAAFLDVCGHFFEVTSADHGRLLRAPTVEALATLLDACGGKSRWLEGRGLDDVHHTTVSTAEPWTRSPSTGAERAATHPCPARDSSGLETFLIDFVVEQTGYPRDMVELDADLEADLGIDSIRKAQLVAEIGQRYALSADDDVSLDEFPTLRHLLDYLLPRMAGTAGIDIPPPDVPESFPAIVAPASITVPDVIVVSSPGGISGVVAAFSRHAKPRVLRSEDHGVACTLVSLPGLPGAVVGWNAAGLLACVTTSAGAGDCTAIESIVKECGSLADVERWIASCDRRLRGVVVAHVDGGIGRLSDSDAIEPVPGPLVQARHDSPLWRVGLADGTVLPLDAVSRLLDHEDPAARSSLSATCMWLACGRGSKTRTTASGGPLTGPWLGDDRAVSMWRARRPEAATVEITQRYGLGTRDLDPVHPVRDLAGERVLLLVPTESCPTGGEPAVATALAGSLHTLAAEPSIACCRSAADAIEAVDHAEVSGAVRHLMLVVTAARERDSAGSTVEPDDPRVVAPFFACQRWLAHRRTAADIGAATLTAVVNLGGDFGLGGRIGNVGGGAVSGLLKGIAREFPNLHVRVVDSAAAVIDESTARDIVAELLDGPGPVEVGFRTVTSDVSPGTFKTQRTTIVPTVGGPDATAPLRSLDPGSVWLVTGGGRGVTAACCRELGRRHGLRLALVGSTAPAAIDPAWLTLDGPGLKSLKGHLMTAARGRGEDPRAAWRAVEKSLELESSLAAFHEAGVEARYFTCDLTDAGAVTALTDAVTREMGPVRGIIHGAGFESACRFERKTRDLLDATVGPKCVGLGHVLRALDRAPIEAIIGFGSTSGRFGGHGQADYSLANDLLAKMIVDLRHSHGLRATVFHWHAWDEVGMASRPESRFVLEQFGLRFMPLAEGVRRFMNEVEAGLPDAEVIVTEPAFCPDAITKPATPSFQPAPSSGTFFEPAPQAAHPRGTLVDAVEREGGSLWVDVTLDPTTDRFLLDHRQFGRPLLPAVMAAELLAQAAVAAGGRRPVRELRNFEVERPLGFPTDRARRVRIEIRPETNGAVEAIGWAGVVNAQGLESDSRRVHFRGIIPTASSVDVVESLTQPPLPFFPTAYRDDSPLWHGPTMRTLKGLFLDRSGGWGRLVAPDEQVAAAPRGARGWTVPVALLDGSIMACGIYSYVMCGLRVEIPLGFARLRLAGHAHVGEECTVRLRFQEQDAKESRYDVTLFGADGRAILALEGLRLSVMSAGKGDS